MKTLSFAVILFSFCGTNTFAQSLERQVIGACGGFSASGWGSLSANSGEAITNTFTASGLVITQGFEQPEQIDVGVTDIIVGLPNICVFPNPTGDNLDVVISNGNLNNQYSVALLDILGQKLAVPLHAIYNDKCSFILDMRHLASATYFLVVYDSSGKIMKTFKINKLS